MAERRKQSAGFTLVEMLIAVALLLSLLAGVVVLFNGSLRAVRTGNQHIDVQEEARGALAIIKEDLMTGFGSVAHSDSNTFYGTPIGMTFIGLTKSGNTGSINQARITYVVFCEQAPADPDKYGEFPTVVDPADPTPRYTRLLLRYEEPNVGDLESFPIPWTTTFMNGESSTSLEQMIENAITEADADSGFTLSEVCKERIRAAKRRELWIRMLGGGDVHVPSAWGILGKDPYDYVLSENLVSEFEPETRYAGAAAYNDLMLFEQKDTQVFFTYGRAGSVLETPAALNARWWNDARRTVAQDGVPTEYCTYYANVRLPEVVRADFLMMRESPHPGAPDLQRRFTIEVLLPAGYRRSTP